MATTTFFDYTGDGSDKTFDYSFPTFTQSDVVVEVNGIIVDNYTIPSYATTGTKTVTFDNTTGSLNSTVCESSGAPKTGLSVRVYRDTGVDSAKSTYTAGSSVKAGDLNDNQTQVLRALQEEQNQTITTTKIKDGAVTTAKILDGTIVDADVNASAAIAQTKIALDADLTALSSMQTGAAAKVALLTATEVETLDGITASTAELNIMDGVTATTAELNYTDGVTSNIQTQLDAKQASDAELTELATMASGTASALADLTQTEVQILDGVTSTTAELNYVDGVTSNVQTQLDAKQASDAELTELATMSSDTASALADLTNTEVAILDGATVTTTELNILDGVTADKDDINIVTNMTKQTTISDQDTSYPTSGAVVDYVAAQIAPIGGLEVIANKDSFPETQPASGVVISIADAQGIVVNGSGTSTTPDTISSDATVTINNINSSFNSSTVDAGVGWLVTSTGSGQIYNYHKANIKESDVVQLSDDINDFNSRYRIASSAPGSANDEGDLYFDTGTNKMYVYDGSSWGEVTSTGDFKYLTLCAFNTGTGNAAVFNGSISKYDLRENSTSGSLASVTNAAQLMVSVNGVVQKPNTGTSIGSNDGFCLVDGHTIEFGANIPSSSEVFVIQSGSALAINVVGDSTVTEAKLNLSGGSNGEFLKKDSTATGGFVWGSVPAGVGGAAGVTFNDNVIAAWGSSATYTILNNSSNIQIQSRGAGPVEMGHSAGDGSNYKKNIKTTADAGVELYYNNAVKLATVTGGATITGVCTATSFAGDGSALTGVAASSANGTMYKNTLIISDDHTIASTEGAHSVGPITVNATVTVNGNWVIS